MIYAVHNEDVMIAAFLLKCDADSFLKNFLFREDYKVTETTWEAWTAWQTIRDLALKTP